MKVEIFDEIGITLKVVLNPEERKHLKEDLDLNLEKIKEAADKYIIDKLLNGIHKILLSLIHI